MDESERGLIAESDEMYGDDEEEDDDTWLLLLLLLQLVLLLLSLAVELQPVKLLTIDSNDWL